MTHKQFDKDELSNELKKLNRPMTPIEFNTSKVSILKLLRAKTDQPPIANVKPASSNMTFAELQEVVHDPESTDKLIRGFKLCVVLGDPACFTYCARPLIALRRANGSIKCLTRDDRFPESPFIFVPSSRVFKEITDIDLVSGRFQMASVLGGNSFTVDAIINSKSRLSIFERHTFANSPEAARVVPRVVCSFFPLFREFIKSYTPNIELTTDVAVSFGMPFRSLTEYDVHKLNAETVIGSECMGGVEKGLCPTSPWAADKKSWLPSVTKLHSTLKSIYVQKTDIPAQLKYELIMAAYKTLGKEYEERLSFESGFSNLCISEPFI